MGGLPIEELLEAAARAFHETYERLAVEHGWETQERSRVPWEQVPENNRRLMVATVRELVEQGVVELGPSVVATVAGRSDDADPGP